MCKTIQLTSIGMFIIIMYGDTDLRELRDARMDELFAHSAKCELQVPSARRSRNFITLERATMVPKRHVKLSKTPKQASNMDTRTLNEGENTGHGLMDTKVRKICDNIAQHITRVSPQKYDLSSMCLHFKQVQIFTRPSPPNGSIHNDKYNHIDKADHND
jgi:cobyric acid synthase